jgi:hypothetical protein
MQNEKEVVQFAYRLFKGGMPFGDVYEQTKKCNIIGHYGESHESD